MVECGVGSAHYLAWLRDCGTIDILVVYYHMVMLLSCKDSTSKDQLGGSSLYGCTIN